MKTERFWAKHVKPEGVWSLEDFIESRGHYYDSTWTLRKKWQDLPHGPKNSYWDKSKEVWQVHHHSSGGWKAHIRIEEPYRKNVYLGTRPLRLEAERLYLKARWLKRNYEYDIEWTKEEWLQAIETVHLDLPQLFTTRSNFYGSTKSYYRMLKVPKGRRHSPSHDPDLILSGDLPAFVNALGWRPSKLHFLLRHDHERPHSATNSYWDYATPTSPNPRVRYHKPSKRWAVHVHYRTELTARSATFYLGSTRTQQEGLILHQRAQHILNHNQHSLAWGPHDWQYAIGTRRSPTVTQPDIYYIHPNYHQVTSHPTRPEYLGIVSKGETP